MEKKSKIPIIFSIILLLAIGLGPVYGKTQKSALTLEDMKLWRSHSVVLSDNGEWHTVIYRLIEKPSEKEKKTGDSISDDNPDRYGKDAVTDTLYIRHAATGREYQIKNGDSPRFSQDSKWIAYYIAPDSKKTKDKKDKKETVKTIELRHLDSGRTKSWKSNASFTFTENHDYLVTWQNQDLSLCELSSLHEFLMGNTGEYLLDKKSDYLVYTIESKDKRGNGIFLFNLKDKTTRVLANGNYQFSNLAWDSECKTLGALRTEEKSNNGKHQQTSLMVFSQLSGDQPETILLNPEDAEGFPKGCRLAVNEKEKKYPLKFSRDCDRVFVHLKIEEPGDKNKTEKKDEASEEPTVNVWHWKDKKLVSQQMVESKKEGEKSYEGFFHIASKKLVRLTDQEVQNLHRMTGTDRWAVGLDNRQYISDWDVSRADLYRIDLISGERTPILKAYDGSIHISPTGDHLALWKEGHYWIYTFDSGEMKNISGDAPVSFIKDDHDYYGWTPDYGFVGWTDDRKAVIANHKYDLWMLPLDGGSPPVNLTGSLRNGEPIRFRIEETNLAGKPDLKDRYLKLSDTILLTAFNTKTKYAGYYSLDSRQAVEKIYLPAAYSGSRWRSGIIRAKKGDRIVFQMGDYSKYPESYLSDKDFKNPIKITSTNPQQDKYLWGKRVLIDYKNDDGIPLQGILTVPDSYKKGDRLPMIVYSYEKLSDNLYRYPSIRISGSSVCEMVYVSDGYLFLQPDIHFNVGTPHSDMHECIDAAIEKVIELGYVDPTCIGYEGFSFGGHCGMYISTKKNRFAAIAAGAGVSNLVQGFNQDIVGDGSNEQDYYMTQQGRLGADPTSKLEMYIRESAVFNAADMNTPLLLFHGTADTVVQWEHSFGLYSILRFLKKPVIFLSYRGEGHGFREKANRLDIQTRLKEFFDHYLKEKSAPNWITDGIPFKRTEKEEKKDTQSEAKRTLPEWK